MVVAGKIFRLTQPMSIANIATKLNGYHSEGDFEEGDYKFKIVSEVTGLASETEHIDRCIQHRLRHTRFSPRHNCATATDS